MKKKDKLKELVVYVIFGALTTLVSFGVHEGLEHFLSPRWGGRSYLFSRVVSFICALAFAFIVNKLFVFRSKSWERRLVWHELATFSAMRLVSFVLMEYLAMAFTFEVLWPRAESWFAPWWTELNLAISARISFFPAFIPKTAFRIITLWCIIQVIVVILNYIFSKWVVFKKKKNDTPAEVPA